MHPDQESYIRAHHRGKSDRQLAKHLGVPRSEVKKLLDKIKSETGQPANLRASSASGLKIWALACLLVITGCALYFNSLKNDFIWDDEFLILHNPFLQSFSHIKDFFTHNLGYASGNRSLYYRPLQETSYAVDYHFWSLNPFGYHLTNMLIHIANTCLAFFLMLKILRLPAVAFLASLFFLIQPMQTQAVTYIAGRADILAVLFMLAAFHCYLRIDKSPLFLAAGALAWLCALFSKEISLLLPILIVGYHFLFNKKIELKKLLLFLSPILVYLLLRQNALAFLVSTPLKSHYPPMEVRFPLSFKLFSFYCLSLMWPTNLHLERQITAPSGWMDPYIVATLILYGSFAFFIIKKRGRYPEALFCAFWFLVFWFPVANIIPLNKALADHWMYMPSIGFYGLCLSLVLTGVYKILPGKKARAVCVAVMLLPFFVYFSKYTLERNVVWKNEISFFEDILKYDQKNNRVLLNLGNTYLERKEYDKALETYDRVIQNQPIYSEAYANRGVIYMWQGKYDKAEEDLKTAIQQNPRASISRVNLAMIYKGQRKLNEALALINEALKITPDYLEACVEGGILYHVLGRDAEAIPLLERAIKIAPKDGRANHLLADIYKSSGRNEEAEKYLEASEAIRPQEAGSGSTYVIKKKFDEWGDEIT